MEKALAKFDKLLVTKVSLDVQVSIEDDGMSKESAIDWFASDEARTQYVEDYGFEDYNPEEAKEIARILLN